MEANTFTLIKERWYGGKVSFSGKVTFTQQGNIQARLRPYSIKTSSRLTRRFGSSRFLRLDVPKLYESDEQRKEVIDYLNKPFYVLDRRFVLLCIKEKESREKSTFGWDRYLLRVWRGYSLHLALLRLAWAMEGQCQWQVVQIHAATLPRTLDQCSWSNHTHRECSLH